MSKHWVILLASGLAEAVWAGALAAGVLQPAVAVVFLVGLGISLAGLSYAMRGIPMGTAYAVWTGVGAVATAVWSALLGEEFGVGKIVCLALIILGVVGLQLSSQPEK